MYEGKEMRRQLIEELRTTHALQAPEQKIKKTEAADLKSKQSLQKEHLHKVRVPYTIARNFCGPKILRMNELNAEILSANAY